MLTTILCSWIPSWDSLINVGREPDLYPGYGARCYAVSVMCCWVTCHPKTQQLKTTAICYLTQFCVLSGLSWDHRHWALNQGWNRPGLDHINSLGGLSPPSLAQASIPALGPQESKCLSCQALKDYVQNWHTALPPHLLIKTSNMESLDSEGAKTDSISWGEEWRDGRNCWQSPLEHSSTAVDSITECFQDTTWFQDWSTREGMDFAYFQNSKNLGKNILFSPLWC